MVPPSGTEAAPAAALRIRHSLLIENPNSGGGKDWDAESFIAAAQDAGITIRHERPEDAEACCALLQEMHGLDAVAVAGGDGTLSPLIACLVERQLPLLVLPAGTANDFARSLNMPRDPVALAGLLTEGQIIEADVGYANSIPFLNAASIGMTNTISRLQTEERKGRWGIMSYAMSAIEAHSKSHSFRATIEGEGKRRSMRCIQLLVGNGRYYGGGMTVHTDATLTDGRLHLHAVVPRSLFGMAALLPFLRFGRTDLAPEVLCEEGANISITTVPVRHVFADGEEITETPVRFHVRRRALRVIVAKEGEK